MEKLIIERTSKSPFVALSDGKIEINGKSIPENPKKFYKPIIEWVKHYIQKPHETTYVDLNFEYIDTSSSKWILDILRTLDGITDTSKKVQLKWFYEEGDYDMFDLGMHLKSFVDISFDFIELEESE